MRKEKLNLFSLLVPLVCLALFVSGCNGERPTSVTLANGPSFTFSGGGRLASFTVSAPVAGEKIAFPCNRALFPCFAGLSTVIWQIEPSSGYLSGVSVQGLAVRYGQPPDGYVQTTSRGMKQTEPLASNVIYAFSAETTNAAGQSGYFHVSESGDVQGLEIPDLCVMVESGHEVKVNCTTKLRYQEPADLPTFIREHLKR